MLRYDEIETSAIDLSFFTDEELSRYNTFISDKRRREFYFTRVLLRSFQLDLSIVYNKNGKPIINEGHISISHSRNIVIIGYSKDHIIGVDIEFYNPKIHRIKHKFLADIEKKNFDTDNEEILTLIWSVKEAIYKMESIPGLLFKEHIKVSRLSHRGEVVVTKNNLEHDYYFDFLIFKEFVITYCQFVPSD